tara:strand:+ start:143 stop:1069 length:927 start_codon:yes stop_codon:yes gene_type:complete
MKILIELPTWLGDTVMASPAIENILLKYPNAKLTLIGSKVSIEVLKSHPKVVKTIQLDKSLISLYKTSNKLEQYDFSIYFRSSMRSKILKFLVSSLHKYQYDKRIYTGLHQVQKYNSFICNSLGFTKEPKELKLFNSKQNARNSTLLVGINPGASYGSAKRWESEKFAEVAYSLSSNYDIIIFGGPNEKEGALQIEKLLKRKGITNYSNLSGRTSIKDLIDHISRLDLFITGDTGPMHIAASFNIPTVSIFGPTKDKETSQWMNLKNIIVKKNLECQPCMERTCPLGHHNCMKLIKPVDVLDAIKLLE